MSAYYNDYIIASNNSINENKYNAAKLAKTRSYKIKKILKPILRILGQKSSAKSANRFNREKTENKVNHSMESGSSNEYCHQDEYQYDYWSSEIDDNFANEELESRIIREIEQCDDDAAIYVYNNDECELQAVHRDQKFVPVHFARTEAGTFFWTTMQKPVDYEQSSHYCANHNQPHFGDRWVQA